eukprot:8786162-Pyramimonas_sp.AAC.1
MQELPDNQFQRAHADDRTDLRGMPGPAVGQIDGGRDERPALQLEGGAFPSPYGDDNRRTRKAAPPGKLARAGPLDWPPRPRRSVDRILASRAPKAAPSAPFGTACLRS